LFILAPFDWIVENAHCASHLLRPHGEEIPFHRATTDIHPSIRLTSPDFDNNIGYLMNVSFMKSEKGNLWVKQSDGARKLTS